MELSNTQLSEISSMVDIMLECQAEVDQKKEELKEAEARLRSIQTEKLPEAMAAAGVKAFTTLDNIPVSIKSDLKMNMPKDKEKAAQAFNWLRIRGLGELISNNITVPVPKGMDKEAYALIDIIERNGFTPERKEAVNTTSAKAALKKRMATGQEVPKELFGIFEYTKAVVKL